MRAFLRYVIAAFALLFFAALVGIAAMDLMKPTAKEPGTKLARANTTLTREVISPTLVWVDQQTLADDTELALGTDERDGALLLRVIDGTNTSVRRMSGGALDMPMRSMRLAFSSRKNGAIVIEFGGSSGVSNGALVRTPDLGETYDVLPLPVAGNLYWLGDQAWLRGGPANDEVFASTDAGQTWRRTLLNELPAVIQGPTQPAQDLISPRAEAMQSGAGVKSSTVENLRGNAFDICAPPSLAALNAWWHTSPYTAVNIYGGPVWACKSKPYTADQVARTAAQGWKLIPTWVGPQSSCWIGGNVARIPNDVTLAATLAITDADAASEWMTGLGLGSPGNPIYFDLESYPADAACRNAAKAFMNSWVSRVKQRGFRAGIYGAPCSSYLADFASIPNPPEAVWVAAWYSEVGFRKTVSATEASCLSQGQWTGQQRLRQYSGGHNETWGGVTLNIDSNVMNGPVINATCNTPRPAPGEVILFAEANFCGQYKVLGAGTYNNVASAGFPNDAASSIRVGGDVIVLACREASLGGICEDVTDDDDFLGARELGNKTLSSLRVVPRPATAARCTDAFEPDDFPAAAKPLPINSVQTRSLCNGGDMDWVLVELQAGKTVVARAAPLNGTSDPAIALYRDDGSTLIASNDDSTGYGAQITYKPTVTARYRLMVRDATGKGSLIRQYNLSIQIMRYTMLPLVLTGDGD